MGFREFLSEYRGLTRLVLGLFAIGIAGGAATVFIYPELIQDIIAAFDERFGESPALDTNLAWNIFTQNLMVSLIAWLGGLILGLAPIFVVLVNGFILGYVGLFVIFSSPRIAENLALLALGLVPHGIFELPAFLLAAVLGLRLGWGWLSQAAQGRRWQVFKESFQATSRYFAVVIAALAIAAIVEVFVSGHLVGNFQ